MFVSFIGDALPEYLPNYTYDDYAQWQGKWELIEGVPYAMSPSPSIYHQSISSKIAQQLEEIFAKCEKCQVLIPVDWKIAENTVVQPDNSVICHQENNPNYLTQAPKIIFEILSKSTAKKDTGIKFDLYEQEGTKYYIIVNPDEKVAKVYQLKDGKYIKIKDCANDSIKFDIEQCGNGLTFDFAKIW